MAFETPAAAAIAERRMLEEERAATERVVARTEAERDLAQIHLKDMEIRVSVDGLVGSRAVRFGESVRPGQQLLVIVPIRVRIEANFKET